jgi:hypothetical protein
VKWETTWLLIRDVLLTGTGLVIIISQIFSRQPSDSLLVTGLALTTPSMVRHASALLGGPSVPSTPEHGPPGSSSSSSASGASPSSSPPPDGSNE